MKTSTNISNRKFYRRIQVLHKSAVDLTRNFVPAYVPVMIVYIITSIYVVIKCRIQSFISFFIVLFAAEIGLMIIYWLRIKIGICVHVMELSKEYLRLAALRDSTPLGMRFYKSCLPLKWKIGSTLHVGKSTFPIIFSHVIITSVINMLVLVN